MNIIRHREAKAGPPASSGWAPSRLMWDMMQWDPLLSTEEARGTLVPKMDLEETEDAYVLRADVPGIEEKDIEISLVGNHLTMGGEREAEMCAEKDTYLAAERVYGSFTCSFTLPAGADPAHVVASLTDGVLCITVPKKPEVRPKKVPVGKGDRPAVKA